MNPSKIQPEAEFDAIATNYSDILNAGLEVTGEKLDYYASRRIAWLKEMVHGLGFCPVRRVLDFGCGGGASVPLLASAFDEALVLGVDVSRSSLEEGRRLYRGPNIQFEDVASLPAASPFDVAYCNGVFHHIPVSQRMDAMTSVHAALRPGGIFALFENNPLNPGTLFVMSRCQFDQNAVTLSHLESCRLMRQCGFSIVCVQSLFYFPRLLRWLRPLEKWLRFLPFGGQYVVLGCKSL